jgi:serine/threonine-protein kinase
LFWADNDVASLHRVLSGNVPRPRKLRPHIAPALEEIVMTAVAHDQDKRFATARDLADAIEIYAHEGGALLAARRIAHWVHDLLGPRDAPWIGESTRVDVPMPRATSGDGSLVDLIAAEVDEPADPTFGPTLPLLPDEVDTDPRRDPPRKRRGAIIAAVIGVAAAAGIAAVVMMNRETSTPREKVKMEIESPSPAPPAAPPPAEVEITTPVETTVETPIVDKPPTERPTRRKPRRESKTTTPPVEAVVEDKQQPPPPTPGSGSQKPNTKVEWKPDLVLPTDPSKKR